MGHVRHFIQELRRRRVFTMAAIYIVAGWVAVQVSSEVFPAVNVPEAAIRYVWLGVLLGLPLALIFSWHYDLTTHGVVRTAAAPGVVHTDLSLQRIDIVILTVLIATSVLVVFYLSNRIIETRSMQKSAGDSNSSIAVLPLENLSGDPDQEYFSAGMHDALITSLSKIQSLTVSSRTSTLRLKKGLSIPGIGTALGVDNVIEGSVTREGNRVRIIVRIISTATSAYVWSESFERELTGILSLQGELARAIANAVEVRLTPDEEKRLATVRTVNPVSYDDYLKGMFQLHKETRRGYRRGLAILSKAVENNPTSALAYAGLAYGYAKLGHSPFPVDGAYTQARDAALKALELDDTLAEAHLAIGMFNLYYGWNWQDAENAFIRALKLNPSLAGAHYHYAWLLELLGRTEEALAAGEKTRELGPLSPFYIGWLAAQYRQAGIYEKAIEYANMTLELRDNYAVGLLVLGNTFAETGEFDKAVEAHEKLRDSDFWSWAPGYSYALAGRIEDAQKIADAMEKEPGNALPLALINAAIGNDEEMFHWLNIAKESKLPWYPWMVAWYPAAHLYYDDPRMQKLATELGLQLRARL